MENKDFDHIFAHKFKQIAGESYQEEGWTELSARIDRYERRRRRWVFPLLLPLFGLLAGSNVFWWYQWREASKNRQDVSQATTLQTDTLVQKTVVYRYDTVYQYITLVQRTSPGVRFDRSAGALLTTATTSVNPLQASAPQQITAETNSEITGFFPTETFLPLEASTEHEKIPVPASDDVPENKHSSSRRVPLPDNLEYQNPESAVAPSLEAGTAFDSLLAHPPLVKKVQKPFFTLARPRINFVAGWGNPLLQHKQSGYLIGAGLGGDVEIARNLRFAVDAAYWKGAIKANETGELNGVTIPDPGSDYKLRYWETYHLPLLSFSFHLRYQFPLKSNWTPWIGLGTQATTYLPFNLEFDYENQNSYLEVFLPGQAGKVTHWRGITGLIGLEGRLGPHVALGAEAFLLRPLGNDPGIVDHQIGLKTRLYYIF